MAFLHESMRPKGIPFKGDCINNCKGILDHCIHRNFKSGGDARRPQDIVPYGILDASLSPGLLPTKLDGCRHLLKLHTASQRLSVQDKEEQIQRDLAEHAHDDLDTGDPTKRCMPKRRLWHYWEVCCTGRCSFLAISPMALLRYAITSPVSK